ncbi:MAG: hypothetical protein K0V04_39800 [Deltaproteobacteria bacterium]|nr:hypothetical protein [Deltaproteobacteria bacterium]
MLRTSFIASILLGLGLTAATACEPTTDDSGDSGAAPTADAGNDDSSAPLTAPEARLCERVDECGYLGAGYSVGDCTDIVGACTDDLLTSAKADWDNAAEDCLELNNCQNFGSCFASIDVCIADIEIEFEIDDDDPSQPSDTGDSTCEPYQVCADGNTLEACIEGDVYSFDCDFVCQSEGFEAAVGCDFDDEAGVDVCFCV